MWIFCLLLSSALAAGVSNVYAAEPAFLSKGGETAPIPTTITAKKVTVKPAVTSQPAAPASGDEKVM